MTPVEYPDGLIPISRAPLSESTPVCKMFSFDKTIEFTDIVLKSSLPVDQYLLENSCLSLRLIINGVLCNETPIVDGDHETGRWVINARLHVPQESDPFKLVAIVNVGGLKVQLLAVDHPVTKVIAHLKERPDGYRKINICEPGCPIQLTVICKTKLSSSPTGPPFVSIRRTVDTYGEHKSCVGSDSVTGTDSTIPSRKELESLYTKAASWPDLDTKSTILSQLGRAYCMLCEQTNQNADLETAVCRHEEAIRFTSAFHPNLGDHFQHAGHALLAQFRQNGDLAVIEKAILHYETALGTTDDGDLTEVSHLYDLGTGIYLRSEPLGHLVDLERAVSVQQKAVKTFPDNHPEKASSLSNLGVSLECRFERLGNLIDVETVISIMMMMIMMSILYNSVSGPLRAHVGSIITIYMIFTPASFLQHGYMSKRMERLSQGRYRGYNPSGLTDIAHCKEVLVLIGVGTRQNSPRI